MSDKERELTCAHLGCTCNVSEDDAYKVNGELFCSEQCGQQIGCDHEGCDCKEG